MELNQVSVGEGGHEKRKLSSCEGVQSDNLKLKFIHYMVVWIYCIRNSFLRIDLSESRSELWYQDTVYSLEYSHLLIVDQYFRTFHVSETRLNYYPSLTTYSDSVFFSKKMLLTLRILNKYFWILYVNKDENVFVLVLEN